ncbi:hypothetical protein [Priestia flexa]|uniref:Uncharacterized protein n=1 Tax=Priestia flexa TaxID=86664 RepID=A0A8I1MJ69_9BACI|nr:hypothetical protein [Priestia flexa]MBN8253856.1 hypothetical protein [Priestia flexa]
MEQNQTSQTQAVQVNSDLIIQQYQEEQFRLNTELMKYKAYSRQLEETVIQLDQEVKAAEERHQNQVKETNKFKNQFKKQQTNNRNNPKQHGQPKR